MLKTHAHLLNCHNFALNPNCSLSDSTIVPQGICKLFRHVRALFGMFISSGSSAILHMFVCPQDPYRSCYPDFPEQEDFLLWSVNYSSTQALCNKWSAPRAVWLLGLGRHALHTTPFLLTGVEWENGYEDLGLSIHLHVFHSPDWGWVWEGARTWQDTLHPALEHQWTCALWSAVQGLCSNTWKPVVELEMGSLVGCFWLCLSSASKRGTQQHLLW